MIYGYVLGQDEIVHVLLWRKAPKNSSFAGHRRCRAGGSRDDCGIASYREFLDVVNKVYFGCFDDVISLLLACLDMYVQFVCFFSLLVSPSYIFFIYIYIYVSWDLVGSSAQC